MFRHWLLSVCLVCISTGCSVLSPHARNLQAEDDSEPPEGARESSQVHRIGSPGMVPDSDVELSELRPGQHVELFCSRSPVRDQHSPESWDLSVDHYVGTVASVTGQEIILRDGGMLVDEEVGSAAPVFSRLPWISRWVKNTTGERKYYGPLGDVVIDRSTVAAACEVPAEFMELARSIPTNEAIGVDANP